MKLKLEIDGSLENATRTDCSLMDIAFMADELMLSFGLPAHIAEDGDLSP